MPLQFAVEENVPGIKYGPGSVEYVIVPKEVAETNDNGCYALFNDDGEQVSKWATLHLKPEQMRASPRSFAKDSMQQTIVEGDYVGYNSSGGNSPIVVGKVVGFTNKQVRILGMSTWQHSTSHLMYETSVIRLPESYWHGSL